MAASADLPIKPSFLDVDEVYSGDEMGLVHRGIIGEGVVSSTGLVVSEKGAGANMSVDIAAGLAWVEGDSDTAAQPIYQCRIGSTINLDVAAADATNPRIDRVVLEVLDATFTGADRKGRVRVIEGTAASSPSAPSEPTTAITLATVAVAANETAITDAEITDLRQPFSADKARTGIVEWFSFGPIPWGYLYPDGSQVLRVQYARLFALTGTTTPYDVGDGSTTFTLPDVRGRFPLANGGGYGLGETGGAATHTLSESEIPAHDHDVADGDVLVTAASAFSATVVTSSGSTPVVQTPGGGINPARTFAEVGGGGAHNNMPPYVGLIPAIRV